MADVATTGVKRSIPEELAGAGLKLDFILTAYSC
jgi:hypothetical protein